MNAYVQRVFDGLKARNPQEKEFLQAATEVLEALSPVFDKHPEYEKIGLLDRFVEPDRIIMFRVPWVDDKGQVQVNRGYHYQTLGELRAVLSLYNIDMEETRGVARNREYHGLVYSATDDYGNRVGNPFKASKIGPSVGYEAVQKRFAWSKKQISDKGIAASLKEKIIDCISGNAKNITMPIIQCIVKR